MTMFSRKAVTTAFAAASLAVAGAALTSAPATAKGGHSGHHGGGHHGHHGGGHWGGHGGHWGHGGYGYVSYYGGGYSGCYVVRQKVFVPGFGFMRRPVTVCD